LVDKSVAFNKMGHNMHDLDLVFERFSYSKTMRAILFKAMSFIDPKVVQSMYIFKNARIGGVVEPHKDNSYLISEPLSCQGIWVGFDEATKNNGCLWGVPESHRQNPKHYMKVHTDPKSGKRNTYMDPPTPDYEYSTEGAVALETPPGSIVILHGSFTHFSEKNTSRDKQRHAYTLHTVESANGVKYSDYNWLQRPKDMPFRKVSNEGIY
jgi:phytanoyl-CoA hydroxylase